MKLLIPFNLFITIFFLSCSTGTTKQKTNTQLNQSEIKTDTIKPMTNKKFKEADNTAVFTTKFVVVDHKEITEVHHDKDDGAWQFFSADNFDDLTKVVKIVGLGQITKMDETLFELADMPVDYVAHRKFKGDKWVIEKNK